VTIYSNPLQLTATLKAPAVDGYAAYKKKMYFAG